MTEPIQITLKLRGQSHTGTLTNSDALMFMQSIMNAQEEIILNQGRVQESWALMQARFDQRQEELESLGKDPQDVLTEQCQAILYKIERDPEERSRIAARLKERFPTLPDNLVRWESKASYAINLHLEELVQIINAVLIHSSKLFEDTAPNVEAVAENTVNLQSTTQQEAKSGNGFHKPTLAPKPSLPNTTPTSATIMIDPKEAKIAAIEAELAKLRGE
jgi:hypothetical protein